jgi:hypothetical protein
MSTTRTSSPALRSFAGTYGAGPLAFFEILDWWRADGDLDGVVLGGRGVPSASS